MGTLTVTFDGICTWIPAWALTGLGQPLPPDLSWRVVLVQAVNGYAYSGTRSNGVKPIPPHSAILDVGANKISGMSGPLSAVRQMSVTTWVLRGGTMSVQNPLHVQRPLQNPMEIIPSLQFYSDDPPPPVPPPLADPPTIGQRSAAYFDISWGTLIPQYLGDPKNEVAHVIYTVDTEGPPVIDMKTFFDDSVSSIYFQDDNVSITVQNEGESTDTWWDFMLNYFVCKDMPPNAYPPGPGHKVDGLTSGCSNSQWP